MPDKIDYMGMQIGHRDRLNRQALRRGIRGALLTIERTSPITAIDIGIGGYDDDPREIYEIPEARRYVIAFAAGMVEAGVPLDRFLSMSQMLIRCCLAAEMGKQVIPTDEPEIDIGAELRAYQERVRRSMQ